MPTNLADLLSLEQVVEDTPALTKRMLVHWLQSNMDGFRDTCAVKVGRRVLLDATAVEAWLEGHRQGKKR